MRLKKLPYRQGIVIPTMLIVVEGYCTYRSVVKFDAETGRYGFLAAYGAMCMSYIMAVKTNPGFTDGTVVEGAKYVECKTCKLPKPERAHHCKTCKRCVLRMDHHCPWTENCVGYNNMGHFVRFLSLVVSVSSYAFWRCTSFLLFVVRHRQHLSKVVPDKSRVWYAVGGAVGDFLVMLTVGLLWLRVMYDTANGQTQIETWEEQRVRVLARRKLLPPKIVFPFDVNFFENLIEALGPIWLWCWPWGGPSGTGHTFNKIIDDGNRWPPSEPKEVQEHEYYRKDRWVNFEGEQLADYGVLDEVNDEDVPLSEFKKCK